MPFYQFQHPEKGDVVEVFFHMNDEKSFFDDEGVEWKRLFSNINFPANSKSFDIKNLRDANGNPLKVQHITNEDAKAHGFDSANDYIECNNAMCDPEKSPEAIAQRRRDTANNKDLTQAADEHRRRSAKLTEMVRGKIRQRSSSAKTTVKTKLKPNPMKKK